MTLNCVPSILRGSLTGPWIFFPAGTSAAVILVFSTNSSEDRRSRSDLYLAIILLLITSCSLAFSLFHVLVIRDFFIFFPALAELRQLRVDLKKTRLAAYRPGTYQNLQSQWRAYLLFCLYFDFTPVPASENVLCLYVQFLSRTLTVGAIRNYLNGVCLFHLFHGIDYPHHSSFPLKLTLLGLAKSSTHTSMQALPITVSVLRRVFHVLHPDTALEWVVYCAALFAFFLIARLSNILPVSTARFDPSRDLCCCNVQFIDSYIAVISIGQKLFRAGKGGWLSL